jgi:hypothetical protein
MSDIGFQGIVTAMVSLGLLAIALIGFIVEGILQWKRRGTPRFAPRMLLGPSIVAVGGAMLAVVAEEGSLEAREVLDRWGWLVALAALIPWIAVHWRKQG